MTYFADGVFSRCSSLSSITIPYGVNVIGDEEFSDCTSLRSVTIPDSVTVIGKNAFYNCTSLSEVFFNGNAPRSLGHKKKTLKLQKEEADFSIQQTSLLFEKRVH